jgi:hypothetical protein
MPPWKISCGNTHIVQQVANAVNSFAVITENQGRLIAYLANQGKQGFQFIGSFGYYGFLF